MRLDDTMNKTYTHHNKFNKIKNIKQINTATPTSTNPPYRNKLWNQNKYVLETWTKPRLQQSLNIRIVDKLPQYFHSYSLIIQTSIKRKTWLSNSYINERIEKTTRQEPRIIQINTTVMMK